MNARRLTVLLLTGLALVVPLSARPVANEEMAMKVFSRRVGDYAALRGDLPVGAPGLTASAEQLRGDVTRLATAIRIHRAHAKAGDIFTADVAAALRRVIAASIRRAGDQPAEVVRRNRAELLPGAPAVTVNERFPWQLGAAMPVYLLADLPPLPNMLEYRLVEHDLVLVDIDAGLVIDILRDAVDIEPLTRTDGMPQASLPDNPQAGCLMLGADENRRGGRSGAARRLPPLADCPSRGGTRTPL